jgi:hypothetical protein
VVAAIKYSFFLVAIGFVLIFDEFTVDNLWALAGLPTTAVRAFETQGNRQFFPATRNPSGARTQAPAHAVIVPIRRQSRALLVSRRRSRFDCMQNCQYNAENTHRSMHIAGWISGIDALSSWPYSSSE